MTEQLVSILFWLILLAPLGVFARQLQKVRSGARRKLHATVLFFTYSVVPLVAYVMAFAALVGIEELAHLPLVSEGISRTLVLVVGIGLGEVLLLTGIFAIVVRFVRPDNSSTHVRGPHRGDI